MKAEGGGIRRPRVSVARKRPSVVSLSPCLHTQTQRRDVCLRTFVATCETIDVRRHTKNQTQHQHTPAMTMTCLKQETSQNFLTTKKEHTGTFSSPALIFVCGKDAEVEFFLGFASCPLEEYTSTKPKAQSKNRQLLPPKIFKASRGAPPRNQNENKDTIQKKNKKNQQIAPSNATFGTLTTSAIRKKNPRHPNNKGKKLLKTEENIRSARERFFFFRCFVIVFLIL